MLGIVAGFGVRDRAEIYATFAGAKGDFGRCDCRLSLLRKYASEVGGCLG